MSAVRDLCVSDARVLRTIELREFIMGSVCSGYASFAVRPAALPQLIPPPAGWRLSSATRLRPRPRPLTGQAASSPKQHKLKEIIPSFCESSIDSSLHWLHWFIHTRELTAQPSWFDSARCGFGLDTAQVWTTQQMWTSQKCTALYCGKYEPEELGANCTILRRKNQVFPPPVWQNKNAIIRLSPSGVQQYSLCYKHFSKQKLRFDG